MEKVEEEEVEDDEDDVTVNNNIPYFKILSILCFLLAILVYFLS